MEPGLNTKQSHLAQTSDLARATHTKIRSYKQPFQSLIFPTSASRLVCTRSQRHSEKHGTAGAASLAASARRAIHARLASGYLFFLPG